MSEKETCRFCMGTLTDEMNENFVGDRIKLPKSDNTLGVSAFISEIDNCLDLFISLESLTGIESFSRKIKINYCPMCGRRLENDKKD